MLAGHLVLKRSKIDPSLIGDVRLGCCIEHYKEVNVARTPLRWRWQENGHFCVLISICFPPGFAFWPFLKPSKGGGSSPATSWVGPPRDFSPPPDRHETNFAAVPSAPLRTQPSDSPPNDSAKGCPRVAGLLAGVPDTVPGVTMNRVCLSGMEALQTGFLNVASGFSMQGCYVSFFFFI